MNKFNKKIASETLTLINLIENNTNREISTPLQVILYDLCTASAKTSYTVRVDNDSFYIASTRKTIEVTMNRHGKVDYNYNDIGHTGAFHLGMK